MEEHRRPVGRPRNRPVEPPNPSGLCACGCGETTEIAKQTRTDAGWVKGEHKRYVYGHQWRKQEQFVEEDRGYRTPCWVWQAEHHSDGYGVATVDGRKVLAHRVFYERRYGPLDATVQVHHQCHTRDCVRPEHLAAMTAHDHSCAHRTRAKLTSLDVQRIRQDLAEGASRGRVAADYGVTTMCISDISRGRTWRDV